MPTEIDYKDLSPIGMKGLNKFSRLKSSKSMKKYGELFTKQTGKNAYDVTLKEDFYRFVHGNRLRRRK